jgi:hypothetical protein
LVLKISKLAKSSKKPIISSSSIKLKTTKMGSGQSQSTSDHDKFLRQFDHNRVVHDPRFGEVTTYSYKCNRGLSCIVKEKWAMSNFPPNFPPKSPRPKISV